MKFNFDEEIARNESNSYKWDFFNDPADLIPMWVADTDFRCSPAIIESQQKIVDHGVLGYAMCPKELKEVFVARMKNLYKWEIKQEWLVWLPGLVTGLTNAIKTVCQPSGAYMTYTPVYHPFHLASTWTSKPIQLTEMIEVDCRYTLDFEAIIKTITPETKMFLLCNPHNPGGTVFRKEELLALIAICEEHNIIICSDEIHCDLILDDNCTHIPLASLSDWAAENTITLFSPSKTFNIAGLGGSVAVIKNEALRTAYINSKEGLVPMISRHAYLAALAGYRDSEDWRLEQIAYLKSNHDYLVSELNGYNGLKVNALEATYLAWVDATATGKNDVGNLLIKNGVRVNDGIVFKGEGFFRVNFGCTRKNLEEGIRRIKIAFA